MLVPSWGSRCGVALYSASLIRELEKAGYLVDLVGPDLVNGARPERWPAIVHVQHKYSLYDRATLKRIWSRSATLRIPSLVTLHTFDPAQLVANCLLASAFEEVLVHSPLTLEALRAAGWRQRITVVPMGVPGPARSVAAPDAAGLGPSIGSAGFMEPCKGFLPLIRAVARLRSAHPGAVCHVFSSPAANRSSEEWLEHIRRECRGELAEGSLRLHTEFEDEERLVKSLAAMDINVFAYDTGTPYATSAAVRVGLAAGRPMIVTSSPLFSDLDEEVHKVAEPTVESIHQALVSLLGDRERQARLAAKAAERAEADGWPNVARMHADIYRAVLESADTGGLGFTH